jgi:hypothetical protein
MISAAYRHQRGQDAAGVAEDVDALRRSVVAGRQKGALALAFHERIQKDSQMCYKQFGLRDDVRAHVAKALSN